MDARVTVAVGVRVSPIRNQNGAVKRTCTKTYVGLEKSQNNPLQEGQISRVNRIDNHQYIMNWRSKSKRGGKTYGIKATCRLHNI